MFLNMEELKTVADYAVVLSNIGNDTGIVTDIIEESISLMKSYLSRFYDVEAIFIKEGAERHKTVLKKLKDIVIYEIYERRTRDSANEVVTRRYAEAMHWLEKLNTGEQGDHTLPPAGKEDTANTQGQSGDIRFGGNTRYTSNY